MAPHTKPCTDARRTLSATSSRRRSLVAAAGGFYLASAMAAAPSQGNIRLLHTFGDSILDCGRYNAAGVHPGRLLVRNDDRLFPEFKGKDLQSHGPARLLHCAVDGSTVAGLAAQARNAVPDPDAVALLTIGGNDLIQGLATDTGPGLRRFAQTLSAFLTTLPIRRVLIGTVYDPTFGDDLQNFLGVPPATARANLQRVNEVLAVMAARHGALVDLHAHFLRGDPSWFVRTIEPSLVGASEVRRAFGAALGVV
jgi:acyl-CoA thioesterase-1